MIEVQIKPQDFQKHWTLPYSILRNTIWMRYYAPGLSAYNQVERSMAPLRKALSIIKFLNETFGMHLDSLRKSIDANLEQRNF